MDYLKVWIKSSLRNGVLICMSDPDSLGENGYIGISEETMQWDALKCSDCTQRAPE